MDMKKHALEYASWGWAVFPVHTPKPDGSCSCHHKECSRIGKHPRISQGRNGATTDPETIERWWDVWPDANIGIATGKESGLVALDVDDGGEDSLAGHALPDTIEQITGSGGRHLIYARPSDEFRYKTRVKFLPGLDSRADGGYIVAPPSLHASGERYDWEGSSDPTEGVAPNAPPDWFLDAIREQPLDESLSTAPEWNPDGELPINTLEMLSAIPAEDYDTWRDVGMALHYTDPADGLEVWDWWSGTAANYSADAVRKEWRNFSRRGHQVANPVTMSTVRKLAEQHGWTDPAIEHGSEVAAALLSSHQRKISEALKTHKPAKIDAPDMLPSSGLIADIASYILQTSIRPQPRMAVAAATAFVSALAGRKYRTETGLMSNLYIAALAQSGHGKDHARKVINKLAMLANVDDYMGGDSIASGQAVVSALSRHPSKLFMIDEFGKFLGALTGQKAAPHQRDVITKLMVLYSSAGSVYRGTEYADQKERPREDIVNPNACVYGTSVPDNFWGAMSSSEGGDGTMSRLVVINTDGQRPARQRPAMSDPAPSLIQAIQALANHTVGSGNLANSAPSSLDQKSQTVPMTDAVFSAWEDLDDDMTENMKDSISASIYSRVAENAAKLAMVYAVSVDHHSPVIGPDAFSWGRELALWSANTLMHNIGRNVADNQQEASHKRVLNMIHDAGTIKRRDLMRRCKFLKKRELDEIVALSIETGEIRVENQKGKAGPAATVYVSVDSEGEPGTD